MLGAGNRPGISVKADRRTGQEKSIHHIADCFRITRFQPVRLGENLIHIRRHQFIDLPAVMGAGNQHFQPPVIQRIQLADQIRKARNRHPVRRAFEYVRVPDNDFRTVSLHRCFQVVNIHNTDGCRKAVHRSTRCNGEAGQAELKAGIARHIRDGARADTDHKVTIIGLVDDNFSQGGFVKTKMPDDQNGGFKSGSFQQLLTFFSRHLIGNAVAEQIRLLISVFLYIPRQAVEGTFADIDCLDRGKVRFSAAALQRDIQIFFNRLRCIIHFHGSIPFYARLFSSRAPTAPCG